MQELRIDTPQREILVDITALVREIVAQQRWQDGVVVLFCPHTTAGLTINEAVDPSVAEDFTTILRRLVPERGDYRHAEGNSDAHVKASLMGADARVFVQAGQLVLGTWQGIFLTEFDGPRTRKVWMQWMPISAAQA